MIDGTIKLVDWGRYASPKFTAQEVKGRWTTCGSPIIAAVTGHLASNIEKHCPNIRRGWSTKALTKYLTSNGYTVVQVTKNSVTNVSYWESQPLNPNHLLLINASVSTKAASWFLLHKNTLRHNDYIEESFNPLYFFNKPTQDVLLVWHQKWRLHNGVAKAR